MKHFLIVSLFASTLALGACGGDNECVVQNAPDLPNNGVDENCDGIDGDVADTVFVAPTGDDANPGTPELPKRTLTEGLSEAQRVERSFVFVSAGSYVEPTLVVSGSVSIIGGYDVTAGWVHSDDPTLTSIVNDGLALAGDFIGIDVEADAAGSLQTLSVEAPAAALPGQSSIGVRVTGTSNFSVINVLIAAGDGGAGEVGSSAADPGEAGGPGTPGGGGSCDGVSGGSGGSAGFSAVAGRNGGNGGRGGDQGTVGQTGGPGSGGAQGGNAGGAGNPGQDGGDGDNGASGADGANGAAGEWVLEAITGNLVPIQGSDGVRGEDGHGGGGGGGGGGQNCFACIEGPGNGAGGGGGGGEAGLPGFGGGVGGHSIALLLRSVDGFRIEGAQLVSSNGGNGGDGGAGTPGGLGGSGASGALVCQLEVGIGGNGGDGGDGGDGGHGGGGPGGSSFGVLGIGSTNITILDSEFNAGTPGLGGASLGFPGPDGVSAEQSL